MLTILEPCVVDTVQDTVEPRLLDLEIADLKRERMKYDRRFRRAGMALDACVQSWGTTPLDVDMSSCPDGLRGFWFYWVAGGVPTLLAFRQVPAPTLIVDAEEVEWFKGERIVAVPLYRRR